MMFPEGRGGCLQALTILGGVVLARGVGCLCRVMVIEILTFPKSNPVFSLFTAFVYNFTLFVGICFVHE